MLFFGSPRTPLCPSDLLISVPRLASCTVIALGTDSVSTVTGAGPVSGTFDVPDLPVIGGTFTGNVDLSLAVLHRVLLGSIAGSFTVAQIADPATGVLLPLPQPLVLPFKGTFRMPFAMDTHARPMRSKRKRAAFYLGDDLRTPIPVRPTELSETRLNPGPEKPTTAGPSVAPTLACLLQPCGDSGMAVSRSAAP